MKTESNNQSANNSDSKAAYDASTLLCSVAKDVTEHSVYAKEIIRSLEQAANDDGKISILGERRMRSHAINCDLRNVKKKELNDVATELVEALFADISRTKPSIYDEVLGVVVPPERKMLWRQLGLLPLGSDQAISDAQNLIENNKQAGFEENMNAALRLGSAFLLNCTAGPTIASESLCGTVERTTTKMQLHLLRDETVTIALYEHLPNLASAVSNIAQSAKLLTLAAEAGAQNIQVYTIQNNSASSSDSSSTALSLATPKGVGTALATGAIDLLLADTQSVFPQIVPVARCYKTAIVTTNKQSHLPGAEYLGVDGDLSEHSELNELAERIVTRAIESYAARKDIKRTIPTEEVTAQVGFTLHTVDRHYGCLDRMASAMIDGKINGIVSLSGCTASNPDLMDSLAPLVDALLANNILIFTNGCAAFSMATKGYCSSKARNKCGDRLQQFLDTSLPPVWHFGECTDNSQSLATFREIAKYAGHKMKDLPFATIVPEWSDEKGLGANFAFCMSGFNMHFCTQSSQPESEAIRQFLRNETKELLGSTMHFASGPEELAELITSQFASTRSELCWR